MPHRHWEELIRGGPRLRAECPDVIEILNRIEDAIPAQLKMVRGGVNAAGAIVQSGLDGRIISSEESVRCLHRIAEVANTPYGRGTRKSLEPPLIGGRHAQKAAVKSAVTPKAEPPPKKNICPICRSARWYPYGIKYCECASCGKIYDR